MAYGKRTVHLQESLGAEDLVANYSDWFEAACPERVILRPISLGIAIEGAEKASSLLPLWLEPHIEYSERRIWFSVDRYPERAVPPAVVLHEVTHLLLVDLLGGQSAQSWLVEGLCDVLPANYLQSPVLEFFPPYDAFTRRLDQRQHSLEDVETRSLFISRIVDCLVAEDLADQDSVRRLENARSALARSDEADQPQPHSLGLVVASALWEFSASSGMADIASSVLECFATNPRPIHPSAWFDTLSVVVPADATTSLRRARTNHGLIEP